MRRKKTSLELRGLPQTVAFYHLRSPEGTIKIVARKQGISPADLLKRQLAFGKSETPKKRGLRQPTKPAPRRAPDERRAATRAAPTKWFFHGFSRSGGFGEWYVGVVEVSLRVDDGEGGDIDDFFHGRATLKDVNRF